MGNLIAQGALTNSKNPLTFPENFPTNFVKGVDCYLYDKNNNRYIDFITALGTNLFGYANPILNEEIISVIKNGNLYSMGSEAEEEFANLINSMFPFIERIKVLKSGTEGCNAAVRIARAYHKNKNSNTTKIDILTSGYHGWGDEFTSLTPPHIGVVEHKHIKDLSKLSLRSIEEKKELIAAIIIEPDKYYNAPEDLIILREICTKNNILLIFDETITALRFPKLLYTNYSEIKPDIIVFGKCLANGLPISLVGAKAEIMDKEYFVSTSFAGDIIPMKVSSKILQLLSQGLDYNINRLWEAADKFVKEFNSLDDPDIGVKIEGYPTRGIFKAYSDERIYLFIQQAANAGLLFNRSFFFNFPLIKESDNVLDMLKKIFYDIKTNKVKLTGRHPSTPESLKARMR